MKQRYLSLDIIRGIALFGILLINISSYGASLNDLESSLGLPSTFKGNTLDMLIAVLIEKKFYAMFSFLFGVGFFIFASRAEAKGLNPLRLFTRRLFFLFLFGLAHLYFFWGSILSFYAIYGLALLPFYRRKTSTIALVMALLFIANCLLGMDDLIILLMFLTGLWFGKKGLLVPNESTKNFLQRVAQVSVPIALAGGVITAVTYGNDVEFTMYIVAVFAVPTTFSYLALLFLVFNQQRAAQLAMPIARVGQMAFTNYLMQNILGVGLLALFGITAVTTVQVLWLAPLIYAIEVVWSWLYFKRFRMGPFEWLWRKCTYGKKF